VIKKLQLLKTIDSLIDELSKTYNEKYISYLLVKSGLSKQDVKNVFWYIRKNRPPHLLKIA
jgi:hypothetical protein